jgi:restriction system protein
MAVPTYDQFIEPLLRILASKPEGIHAKEAYADVADALALTAEDKQELLPSGQPTYKNRAGWAYHRLKRARLSSNPRRGFWRITGEGVDFMLRHAAPFSVELTEKVAMGYADVEVNSLNATPQEPRLAHQMEQPPISKTSPDDRLGQALQELHQAAEVELLELLSNVSPGFFETIVLDLLHRMGYGASRDDLQRVGGTGDGGIDGVISLDRLGLEKVYVQAKRWQGNVGRPDLQAFYGALAGQKAKKGVFITTSEFTSQAIGFAKSVEGIVLVDGLRLVGLMIEYELGVSARTVKIPKIDGDYFDEEAA